jgi:DNA modification methylase
VKAIVNLGVRHPAMMKDLVAGILIQTFTKPNDHVVDLFNGANTTGITCTHMGRDFTGFEINEDLFLYGVVRTKNVRGRKSSPTKNETEIKNAA